MKVMKAQADAECKERLQKRVEPAKKAVAVYIILVLI
jgi:hypothetical protein